MADPRDDHPAHIERRSIAAMSIPDPFRPGNIPFSHDTQEFGPEIRHTGEEGGPIDADLLITIERPVRVGGLLTPVSRVEAGNERVKIVVVHRLMQPGDDRRWA